jgi:hypothetical protein
MSSLSADQRARLSAAKLSALVTDHAGAAPGQPHGFGGGAAVMVDDTAWVLIDDQPVTGLGRALAWAERQRAAALSVVADAGTGVLARRATAFDLPIAVWTSQGRQLHRAEPDPVPAVVEPSAAEVAAAAVLADMGVDVVVEHGVVTGEVRGLEMARVMTVGDDVMVLPGVGRNDRDGHATLLADANDAARMATLARVAADITAHRSGDAADRHPLGRMARERWLRRHVVDTPELVGAASLTFAEPTVGRTSLTDMAAAYAVGADADGTPVVVACSVGIDLDLVPAAADVRLVHEARSGRTDCRLVLVTPGRSLQPVIGRLAQLLVRPADMVVVDDDWYRHSPPPQ